MENSPELRARTTSLTHPPSSLSTASGHGAPTLRPRSSMASVHSRGCVWPRFNFQNALLDASFCSSDTGTSDVLSPFPRRHHLFQQHVSYWLETPSPGSTRPNSPSSVHSRTKRRESISGFASLYADDHRGSTRHPTDRSTPARRWVRWVGKIWERHWVVPSCVLVAVGIKWATGLGSYSGM